MKKLFIVLVLLLALVLLPGCLPDWVAPGGEEPEVAVLEALANADLVFIEEIVVEEIVEEIVVEVIVEEAYWTVDWSIVNSGDKFIREYLLKFTVEYPDLAKDNIGFELTGNYLEVAEKHVGEVKLAPYGDNDTPVSVFVTWELFE